MKSPAKNAPEKAVQGRSNLQNYPLPKRTRKESLNDWNQLHLQINYYLSSFGDLQASFTYKQFRCLSTFFLEHLKVC